MKRIIKKTKIQLNPKKTRLLPPKTTSFWLAVAVKAIAASPMQSSSPTSILPRVLSLINLSYIDDSKSMKSRSFRLVFRLGTGSDWHYRITVHPGGDSVICALQQSCRLFEREESEGNEVHKLGVKVSEKVLTQLEDIGQQLALTFNSEGSIMAVGGEDEVFAFCRFSQISDKNPVLYIAAVTDHGGSVLTWNTTTWKRMRSSRVVREAISAFNVSAEAKLLAVGTVGGDLFIINSFNIRVQMMVKGAHLGLITALTFSHDSRALISASMDSSARVTLIKDKTKVWYAHLSPLFVRWNELVDHIHGTTCYCCVFYEGERNHTIMQAAKITI
ncbi:hypothetical protein CRYUN_Cryun29cG0070200 [Craigia yunnanensis]